MTSYDKEYYEASIEALHNGKVYTSRGRKYVRYKGKSFPLSRALWNLGHPDDPVLITEVIHHKDGDRSNDTPNNLEKMSAGKHMQLHVLKRRGEYEVENTIEEAAVALKPGYWRLRKEILKAEAKLRKELEHKS